MASSVTTFSPGEAKGTHVAVAATTASAEQVVGGSSTFEFNTTGDVTMAFGAAGGVPTPDATCYRIPANTRMRIELPTRFVSFKVYNPGATGVDTYWIRTAK